MASLYKPDASTQKMRGYLKFIWLTYIELNDAIADGIPLQSACSKPANSGAQGGHLDSEILPIAEKCSRV